MTTIDHRILIPAAPDVVWNYVSDITHNPDWQVDCSEVIFLTSRREGPGVRWRYASPEGHERVVAVSAWYNGLGYEYYFVDGMPFRENKGRIRLQEIPEGTIVQWTFTYELGGLFGGMRNALGVSREVDHTISDSLKTLWQKIKQSGGSARAYEPKSLMRDAPDVEARSTYQPRHPSPVGSGRPDSEELETSRMPEPPIREDDGQPISVIASLSTPMIDEPPVAEDDTRPRIAVTGAADAEPVPPDIEGEPEFLGELVDLSRFEPPRDPTDTQPKRPISVEPAPEPPAEPVVVLGDATEPLGFTPPETLPDSFAPPVQPERYDAPDQEDVVLEESEADFPLREAITGWIAQAKPETQWEAAEELLEPASMQETPEPATAPVNIVDEPTVENVAQSTPTDSPEEADTASIWDVFGVPRPSETQQTEAVSVEPEPEPIAEQPVMMERDPLPNGTSATHAGLRIRLRRKLARVRRL